MFAALFTAIVVMASAPSQADIDQATRGLLADRAVQKKLPGQQVKKKTYTPAQTKRREQKRKELRRRRARSSDGGNFSGSLGRGFMYVFIGICLAIVLFMILRGSMGYQGDAEVARAEAEEEEADRGVVERPLGDAELLAQAGNFADAVHTLLLRTLMELSMKRGQPVPSSLTSREILTRVGLPQAASAALAEIVDVVEISHFGDLPIGQDEYQRCLDSYSRFSAAYLRGAAA